MYNFNHLYYFYITVKSGGVTSASKHLLVSQPSLSGQLKVLEDFLQMKLFKKIGRKNELTKEGTLIYGFCRKMFELSEEMHESCIEKIPHASRQIQIGVSNEIANSFVVQVISSFLSKHKNGLRPKFSMISGNNQAISELLKFKEIDIAVTSLSVDCPEIENLQCIEVPVNLICYTNLKKHSSKKSFNIIESLKALGENGFHQWVMPSHNYKLRSEINNFFHKNSIKGKIVFESDVMESIARSVVDKIGLTFLPLIYVPKELENNSLYFCGPEEGFWKHQICISSHNINKDDQLIQSISMSFKDVCNQK